MNTEHRAGVYESCLLIRHLKLDNLDTAKADAIGQEIDKVSGVDMVSLNEDESLLNVAYDASKLNIDDIEAIVRKHGADISHSWWTHFKEGWYRFNDENARENFKHAPESTLSGVPPSKSSTK